MYDIRIDVLIHPNLKPPNYECVDDYYYLFYSLTIFQFQIYSLNIRFTTHT